MSVLVIRITCENTQYVLQSVSEDSVEFKVDYFDWWIKCVVELNNCLSINTELALKSIYLIVVTANK